VSLRLEPSVAVRERRLTRLLAERGLSPDDARLARIVEDAELVGSLELAGLAVSWDDARAETPPPQLRALRRARAVVSAADRFTLAAVRAWHEALAGPVGFRSREAAGARPEFIEDRLASLAEWLDAKGAETVAQGSSPRSWSAATARACRRRSRPRTGSRRARSSIWFARPRGGRST
jgi:hypothetical protein